MSVRQAAVAGMFYPNDAEGIRRLLEKVLEKERKKRTVLTIPNQIIGGIVPHAGYVYAGNEAVHFFSFLQEYKQKVDTFIILNPSHSGARNDISFDSHDAWKTPFGSVELDTELMDFINIPRASDAQQDEHSAEVILPYLQYFIKYPFKIMPVCMRKQSYKTARDLAEKIFKANQVMEKNIVIIASTDFSHYVRPEVGFYNDNLVINRILNNSIRGLYDTIHENNISVCGYGPIMTLMFYSRMISSSYKVEILARGNSAKRSKEELVVDYVSALFFR